MNVSSILARSPLFRCVRVERTGKWVRAAQAQQVCLGDLWVRSACPASWFSFIGSLFNDSSRHQSSYNTYLDHPAVIFFPYCVDFQFCLQVTQIVSYSLIFFLSSFSCRALFCCIQWLFCIIIFRSSTFTASTVGTNYNIIHSISLLLDLVIIELFVSKT